MCIDYFIGKIMVSRLPCKVTETNWKKREMNHEEYTEIGDLFRRQDKKPLPQKSNGPKEMKFNYSIEEKYYGRLSTTSSR